MSKDTESLLDFFFDDDKTGLQGAVLDLLKDGGEAPLDEVFTILDETEDIEVTGILLELLFVNHENQFDDLVKAFKQSDSDVVRFCIVFVFCLLPNINSMDFLIDTYLQSDRFRSHIRKVGFKDKSKLLLSLAKYVESHAIPDSQMEVVCDLLCLVPRSTFVRNGNQLTMLKIFDIYHAIPPELRAK